MSWGSQVCPVSHLYLLVYAHTCSQTNDKIILFLVAAAMCTLPAYLFVDCYIKSTSKIQQKSTPIKINKRNKAC